MTQPIRWLQNEIADRMLQKLEIVKLDTKDVLVVPDFPGGHLQAIPKRFSKTRLHGLHEIGLSSLALWKLRLSRLWHSRFAASYLSSFEAYKNTGRLPLRDNSVDLIFSVLLIQDLSDPKHFLQECRRVLREGGLLAFSYLGPDTAKELRSEAFSQRLSLRALPSPWDMHDMGDALLGEGFSDPVMDMEFLNLDYESNAVLLQDVKALNLVDAIGIEGGQIEDLPKKLTLEVVYGHAWVIGKHLSKAQDHVAYIDPNQIGRITRSDSA
ncbi:MAG: methyltransferase type 11 [Polynucleobacter sp. 32-46-5]|nr:MAG: methyltransferase type 11 [Polynucleobacter sp. 32-46-5]